jgi:hypothetical protein
MPYAPKWEQQEREREIEKMFTNIILKEKDTV